MKKVLAIILCVSLAVLVSCASNGYKNESSSSSFNSGGQSVIENESTVVKPISSKPTSSKVSSKENSSENESLESETSSTSSQNISSVEKATVVLDENYPEIYPKTLYYKPLEKYSTTRFSELTADQKRIYKLLDTAAFEMETQPIKLGKCEANDIYIAYFAMLSDRPEYFWLPTKYGIESVGKEYSFKLVGEGFGYTYTKVERRQVELQIKQVLKEFNDHVATAAYGDYDRERIAHDWLISRVKYCSVAEKTEDNKTYKYAWNIQGALVKGEAVCEGYSRAMSLLLNMLGIKNRLVVGDTERPHMWNLVKIGGEYYHLDATANDAGNGAYYTYFNLDDSYIAVDHKPDTGKVDNYNFEMPLCVSTDHNYFYKNKLVIASPTDTELISEIIVNAVINEKSVADLLFTLDNDYFCGKSLFEKFNMTEIIYKVNLKLSDNEVTNVRLSGVSGSKSCRFEFTLI